MNSQISKQNVFSFTLWAFVATFLLTSSTSMLGGCKKKAEDSAVQNVAQATTDSSASLSISGTIDIDPKLSKKVKSSDVIFIIARPIAGGPPLAAKKLAVSTFPVVFSLTAADLMMPGQMVNTPLNLQVRIDKDGEAMTKNAGDLVGTYEKNPVAIQAQNVTILVNEVLQ